MNPYSNTQTQNTSLTYAVGEILEEKVSKEAKDLFINNDLIKSISTYPNPIQREIINRHFYALLLNWRSKHNKPVFELFPSLCRDGDIRSWFNLFVCDVIPFIRENGVLSTPLPTIQQ